MQLFLILVLLLICVVAGNSGDISVVLVEAEVLKDHDSTIVVDDDTSEADAPVRKQNLGYSDYYSLIETLSSKMCFEVINNLPISNYFDVHKGKFKTGILGEFIAEMYPDLVSYIDKRFVNAKTKDHDVVKDMAIVDLTAILYYEVGAIQYLNEIADDNTQSVGVLTTKHKEEKERIKELMKLYGHLKEESSSSLQLSRAKEQIRLSHYDEFIKSIQDNGLQRKEQTQLRYKARIKLRDELNTKLQDASSAYHEAKLSLGEETLKQVTQIRLDRLNQTVEKEEKEMALEFDASIRRIQAEREEFETLTQNRLKEDIRIERETQDIALNIMRAQSEASDNEVQAMITTVSSELNNLVAFLINNYVMLTSAIGIALCMTIVIVVVYEAIMTTLFLWRKSSGRSTHINYKSMRTPSLFRYLMPEIIQNKKVDAMILSSEEKSSMKSFSHSLQSAAVNTSVLPYILLYGPSGTGKSVMAEAIAHDSTLPYYSISGSELVGLGPAASDSLYKLISSHLVSSEATVLIITDVDEIISARSNGATGTNCCLYTLLHFLKQNQNSLSVVLTSSSSLTSIDAAILDRMDMIYGTTLPEYQERLQYYSLRLREKLGIYLNPCVGNPALSLDSDVSTSRSSPETDIPSPSRNKKKNSTRNTNQRIGSVDIDVLRDVNHILDTSDADAEFDADLIKNLFLGASAGWSYHDIDLVLDRCISAVLGTRDLKLTNRIVAEELITKLEGG
jgi:hypothetical protein